MADSKKYNGSTWEHSLRKLTTATDTITTLPADVYADGNNATVGISGNTVQSGTPNPDNPIMPQGTGERTGNQFDAATAYGSMYNDGVVSGTAYNVYLILNHFNESQVGKQITISIRADKVMASRIFIDAYIAGTTYASNSIYTGNTGVMQITVTPQSTSDSWRISYGSNANEECILSNIMLNFGSTPLPYEPYGYKIPIQSANTTTPVYLGEVQTTRKVKKLVLTGDEEWSYVGGQAPFQYLPSNFGMLSQDVAFYICSHYKAIPYNASWSANDKFVSASNQGLRFKDTTFVQGLDEWKSYLAQQYAAGTPVTVWYVLATEKTGIVNEPLMKIGDYADTVNGITVPTITGKDTFDVETTLKPSKASLSYTGWHDATVKEWDGSDWQ